MSLTADQVAQFERDGYLVLPAVFNPDEIAEMAAEADRLLALSLNSVLATGQWNPRIDASQKAGRIDFRKLQPINDLSMPLRRASEDERLVGPLRQLMDGQQPVLMEEKLNYKQVVDCPELIERFNPRQGDDRFPLHHDWGYYRQQGYPASILSSAIAIDASTHQNGPLRVIPGTHTSEWPLQNPDPKSGTGVVVDTFDESARVDVVAPPGSVMLFHSMLLHDSKPNESGRPRRIMIYSHYPGNYSFPPDARNRWGREAGQKIEDEYRALLEAGAYQDRFHAPV